jgi:transposase
MTAAHDAAVQMIDTSIVRCTIKQCRRIATRYDKLAINYLTFIKLASIRILLRADEVTS